MTKLLERAFPKRASSRRPSRICWRRGFWPNWPTRTSLTAPLPRRPTNWRRLPTRPSPSIGRAKRKNWPRTGYEVLYDAPVPPAFRAAVPLRLAASQTSVPAVP